LNKFTKRKTKKRIIVVDLLVIRVSKTGKLGNSRPCKHCLLHLSQNKDVKVRNVYYSTRDTTIVREKFNTMLESDKTYVSSGFRHRNKKKD